MGLEAKAVSYEIGEAVKCVVCRRHKKPTGRSAPLEMSCGLCDSDCPGYAEEPPVGDLWPGESREDFGYPKELAQAETIKRLRAEVERQRPVVKAAKGWKAGFDGERLKPGTRYEAKLYSALAELDRQEKEGNG